MLQLLVLVLLALDVGQEQLVHLLPDSLQRLLQLPQGLIFLLDAVDEYLVGAVLVGCAVLAVDELHDGVVFVLVGGGAVGEVAGAALQAHRLVHRVVGAGVARVVVKCLVLELRIELLALQGEAVGVSAEGRLEPELLLLAEESGLHDACEPLLLVGETQKQLRRILGQLLAFFSRFVDGRLGSVPNVLAFLL